MAIKERERVDRCNEQQTLSILEKNRKNQLDEYMKSIAKESWASNNSRIHAFINTATSDLQRKRETGQLKTSKVDTHSRMGFSTKTYETLDLAGRRVGLEH